MEEQADTAKEKPKVEVHIAEDKKKSKFNLKMLLIYILLLVGGLFIGIVVAYLRKILG